MFPLLAIVFHILGCEEFEEASSMSLYSASIIFGCPWAQNLLLPQVLHLQNGDPNSVAFAIYTSIASFSVFLFSFFLAAPEACKRHQNLRHSSDNARSLPTKPPGNSHVADFPGNVSLPSTVYVLHLKPLTPFSSVPGSCSLSLSWLFSHFLCMLLLHSLDLKC